MDDARSSHKGRGPGVEFCALDCGDVLLVSLRKDENFTSVKNSLTEKYFVQYFGPEFWGAKFRSLCRI